MTLDVVKFHVQQMINKTLFNTTVDVRYEEHIGGVIISALQRIASEPLDAITATYPDGAWQAVKETKAFRGRWNPLRTYVDRHPVRLRYLRLEAQALYPKISLPHESHVIRFLKFDESAFVAAPNA